MTPTLFVSAAEGIACEEELLATGRPQLLLWQAAEPSLVVPKSWARREGFAGISAACREDGWPLILRSSGGGGVPQGPGTINLAMVLPVPDGFTLEDGYCLICGGIADALKRFNIESDTGSVDGAFCDGAWNITVAGKKLAGTAQRWISRAGERVALIHAAILVRFPDTSFWKALEYTESLFDKNSQVKQEVHVSLDQIFHYHNQVYLMEVLEFSLKYRASSLIVMSK